MLDKNQKIALYIISIIILMLSVAYAAAPLYNLFCRITGYDGRPKKAEQISTKIGKTIIKVRFNTDIDPNLEWSFMPLQKEVKIKTGENKIVYFEAMNKSDKTITGTATFNIVPEKVAKYFNKIQCFCFNNQTLKPQERVKMPVSFFIDPSIEEDINAKEVKTITLSYTFFQVK